MTDAIGDGVRVVWAQDEAGEIGKRPQLEPGTFEIDGRTYCEMAELLVKRQKGGKR